MIMAIDRPTKIKIRSIMRNERSVISLLYWTSSDFDIFGNRSVFMAPGIMRVKFSPCPFAILKKATCAGSKYKADNNTFNLYCKGKEIMLFEQIERVKPGNKKKKGNSVKLF